MDSLVVSGGVTMIGVGGIVITDKMHSCGMKMSEDLYDAGIRKALGGWRGCKVFDYNDFTINQDLIKMYIEDEIDSVQAIYIAMERCNNE